MEKREITLVSDTQESSLEMRGYLRHLSSYMVNLRFHDEVFTPEMFQSDVIIFDCAVMTGKHFISLWQLAKVAPHAKLLIVAHQIPVFAYRKIVTLKNAVVMQKPITAADLKQMLEKLEGNLDLAPVRFPRFHTHQPARIMVLKNGLLIPTYMKNYSAGGAFLEYRGISLRIGDRLQIGMVDEHGQFKPKESIQYQAKVVWIHDGQDPKFPDRGVGVQFVETTN